jgi:alkanesulfonate monooxygenase SsuD/methylene tetrahydromethanopterin reductase-like flavin-dependent oxidoreductase (luciferase family)
MRAWYFSENPYPHLPDPSTYESIRVSIPSRYYDPQVGAALSKRYLEEWHIADELGLEIMVNEHHQTATNLVPAPAVTLGALTQITKNARLLLLGNPVANRPDPVRIAEEMAMVDNYSLGRLDVGFVRGVPYETFASNAAPVAMSDRMWESIDLILKAWTSHDGPFNWEGRYFTYRNVNVWPRTYQQPHPPIWVTTGSASSVVAIAERGYKAATFLTGYDATKKIFDAYRATRRNLGFETPDDRLGYLALVYVGDTDEAGYEGAKKLRWYLSGNKVARQFQNPPGYHAPALAASLLAGGSRNALREAPLETVIEQGVIFAGNPDTVYAQIKRHYEFCGGYGELLMMSQAGFMGHDEAVRGMTLFAKEVYPRIRDLEPAAAGR